MMKTKIGTVIEEDIIRKLKEYSARENRSISEVIESALLSFFQSETKPRELRLQAVEQLCSKPFNLSPEDLKEIVEEDYYRQ